MDKVLAATEKVDLASYDVILVSTSAGKDSQAMLDVLVELATELGVRDRIVAVHADLGRVEWEGTRELAERQANHYGVRFIAVKRSQNDLLDHVAERGMWPSSTARYCTSDHKRGPIRTVMTRLVEEVRSARKAAGDPDWKRPVRIVNCMGLRAEESPARSKKVAFENDASASNGKRTVDTWLPIHGWLVGEVWDRIRASGVEHHRAYDLGMPRLSCCFCVMASEASLLLAGIHNRKLLAEYVAVEQKINHDFRHHLPILKIAEKVAAGCTVDPATLVAEKWCSM